jgi:hypothetical protein
MTTTAVPTPGKPQKVLEYSLRVRGVFGRNRTVKSKCFKLAQDQLEPLAAEELQALVDAMLAKVKVKDGAVDVFEQKQTVEAWRHVRPGQDPVVMVSRSFEYFSSAVLQKFNVFSGKAEPMEPLGARCQVDDERPAPFWTMTYSE